jgi:phosphatidate phosphatase APP1
MRRVSLSLCIALLLTGGTPVSAEPALLLAPGLGSPRGVLIHGRVLRDRTSLEGRPLSRNLRKLLAPEWRGAPVKVSALGVRGEAKSDGDGDFSVPLLAPSDALFVPGLYPVQAAVPGAQSRGWLRIVADEAPFVVVSDFDDTVAVTQVIHPRQLVTNALLRDADTHAPVPGMNGFYRCLLAEKVAQPGLAFVSGTPVQFFPRMSSFLRLHEFPPAALYLRNLGFSTLKGYKEPVLQRLAAAVKNPFLLVGDSGEKDPEIYKAFRALSPERVLRIYIRNAGRTEDATRFEGMFLFDHAREAAQDAVLRGYMSQECLEREFAEGAR